MDPPYAAIAEYEKNQIFNSTFEAWVILIITIIIIIIMIVILKNKLY